MAPRRSRDSSGSQVRSAIPDLPFDRPHFFDAEWNINAVLDNKSRKFKTIITAPNKVQYTTKTSKLKEASYYAFNRNPEGAEFQIRKIGEFLKKITEALKVAESEFGDSKLVQEMKRALKLLSSRQERLNSLHIELKDLNVKIYDEKKKKDTCGFSS